LLENITSAGLKIYLCDAKINSMEFTVNQIAQMLDGKVDGDGSRKIKTLKKIQEGTKGSISFLSNPKYESFIYDTYASAVIVDNKFTPKKKLSTTIIRVNDPYLSFSVLLEEYHHFISFQKFGVETPSFIGVNTKTGDKIYRGAFSYIGDNARIGKNVKIFPHAYIGDNVVIGDNTILHSGVKIYSECKVGSNCVLHSGTVIGGDGFGFALQKDGSYKTIPQLGNVVIRDFVHIGSNTTIDCATMAGDSTMILEGVKLDNLVQIGHNVSIGKHTVIAAQTGISGSTKTGDYCIIAGQVGFSGHIEISNHTSVGAQAGVLKSTKAEGEKLLGSFAIDVKNYISSYAVFKKLPELNRRLKELEEKILNLPTV